nr:hypothetical protein [Paludibacteraceae bacterium]
CTDKCGNVADPVSVTYTWKVASKPKLSATKSSADLDCNPTEIPVLTKSDFTVTNACGDNEIVVTGGDVVENGCGRTKTYTATYSNGCYAADPVVVTYKWTVANAPALSAIPSQTAVRNGCKYAMPDLEQVVLSAASDDCGGLQFVSQSVAKNTLYEVKETEQTIPVEVKVKNGCGMEQSTTVNVVVPARRALSISAKSESKLYDGTPLTAGYDVEGDLYEGDVLQVVTSGTITKPGTASNTLTYSLKNASDEDVSCYYNVIVNDGELEVKCVEIEADKYDGYIFDEPITFSIKESNSYILSNLNCVWQLLDYNKTTTSWYWKTIATKTKTNTLTGQKFPNPPIYVEERSDYPRKYRLVLIDKTSLDTVCFSNEITLNPSPCSVEWKGFVGDGVISESSETDTKGNPVTKYVVKAGSSYSLSFDNIVNWKRVNEFKRSQYDYNDDTYSIDINKSSFSDIQTKGSSYTVYSHNVSDAQTSYKYRVKYTDCDGQVVWKRIFVEVQHDKCADIKLKVDKPEGYVYGETVTIDLVSLDNGDYLTDYRWESSNNNVGWTPIDGADGVRYDFVFSATSPRYFRLATPDYNCVSNVVEVIPAPCSIEWNGVKGDAVQLISVDSMIALHESNNYSRLENIAYTLPVGSRFEIGLDVVNSTNANYGLQKLGRRLADNSYGLNTGQKASNKDFKYYEDITPKDDAGNVIRNGVYVVESADVTYEYYLEYKDCSNTTKKCYFIVRVVDECNSDNTEIIWYDNFGHFGADGASYYQFVPETQTYKEPISTYESGGKKYDVKFLNDREGYLTAVPDFNNAVVGHTFIMDTLKSNCPQCIIDGTYEILYDGKMISKDGRHWHHFTDHTGDDKGGMLLVNLQPNSRKIYEREFELSCNDAMVVLSCYLANANLNDLNDAGGINDGFDPNIRLEVLADGVPVGECYSGDICERDRYTEPWLQLTASFLGKKGVKYKMILHNNQTNSATTSGNDLLIDDILIKACYPQMVLTEKPNVVIDPTKSITICGTNRPKAAVYANCAGDIKKYFVEPYYFYQYQDVNGVWIDVTDQNHALDSCVITVPDYPNGTKFRVIVAKDKDMVDWVVDQYNQSTEPVEVDRYPKYECMHPYGVSTDFILYYYPMLERLFNRTFLACYGEEKTLDIKEVYEGYINRSWFDSEDFLDPIPEGEGKTQLTFTMDRPLIEHWFAVSGENGVCPDTVKYVTTLNKDFSIDCGPELNLYLTDKEAACSYSYKDTPTPNNCLPDPQYTYYYKLSEDAEYVELTDAGIELPLGINTIYWKCALTTSLLTDPVYATCEQVVKVSDLVKPVCSGVDMDIVDTKATDGCATIVKIALPDAKDNCGTISKYEYKLDDNAFEVANAAVNKLLPVGEHIILWRVTDGNKNVSEVCSTSVTVADKNRPACKTVTVNLQEAGKCSFAVSEVEAEFNELKVDLSNLGTDNCALTSAEITDYNGITSFEANADGSDRSYIIKYTLADNATPANTTVCPATVVVKSKVVCPEAPEIVLEMKDVYDAKNYKTEKLYYTPSEIVGIIPNSTCYSISG